MLGLEKEDLPSPPHKLGFWGGLDCFRHSFVGIRGITVVCK